MKDIHFKWFIGLAVWLIIILALVLIVHHRKAGAGNVITPVQMPTFQRGDCFEVNEYKEVWEKSNSPEGIIEKVGKASYLILFRTEAEKRGGDKYGSKVSIPSLDMLYHKVSCPKTWVNHTHRRIE